MSDLCPRAGRWIGGCRFRPRYDTVEGAEHIAAYVFSTNPVKPGRRTYICDVCERCGKTLFRRKDAVKP